MVSSSPEDQRSAAGAAIPGARTPPGDAPGSEAAAGRAAGVPPLPSVSVPKPGGAIRGIGEKFEANAANGTGMASVPIATSPGRSGFGPQLSLTFDSGRGNGPFGFGWSLSVPSITRKTDKGLPRYADAEDSDVFLLSGAEDLVPRRGYGGGDWARQSAVEPAYAPGFRVERYRPRVEAEFARVERWTRLADGDAHWRTVTRDNITTWYGEDDSTRVRDPADPARVFSWLPSRSADDRGNVIAFGYAAEDDRGVDTGAAHERNRDGATRAANRYLKRIRYGNRVSALTEPQAADPGWMFEVVFDYGDHAPDTPAPAPDADWACRDDPFSSYRSGFEVRTYRRCQRILMFHHFPDEDDVGAECLVRSTDLTYRTGEAAGAFLTSVTQRGYRRRGGGYLSADLPPVEFGYSPADLHGEVVEVAEGELASLPAGLAGDAHRFVDLDGEGIAGFLARYREGWYYKANLGGARFAPGQLVTPVPATVAPGATGSAELVDLSGDGRLDLASFAGPTAGYFTRAAGNWAPFAAFAALPALDWADPNLRFVDLTGDGHADLLLTEDAAMTWHPSLGRVGFGPAGRQVVPRDEERGPRLVFAEETQSLYLADMSGDGLNDLVRVRNGEVCYWPNLGYGRFGRKVSMDGAPWFDRADAFDQRRIRLADVDGSGVTDIVYLGATGVRVYLNRNGNSWAPVQLVSPLPTVDDVAAVAAVDLLGTGTTCLVWSLDRPADGRRSLRYLDLLGATKPHLLTSVVNNLGAQTTVSYAPSTAYYLADRATGQPWLTRLPFPVQVVARVETYDRVSRCRYVQRFAYHHGYFDGQEREFRGFAQVEQWDTEELATLAGTVPEPGTPVANEDAASHTPPVLTKTWYHTGAFVDDGAVLSRRLADGYWREPGVSDAQHEAMLLEDTVWPDSLRRGDGTREVYLPSADELREACRALKGSQLRREVYALDGSPAAQRPYSVSERNYSVELLQPLRPGDRHAVCFVHARETVSYQYERALFDVDGAALPDPRVTHDVTLDVDGYGNLLASVSVAYPRRHPDTDTDLALPGWAAQAVRAQQTRTLATTTVRRYTNAVDTELAAPDATADFRVPLPCETRTFELTVLPVPAAPPGPVPVGARYGVEALRSLLATAGDGAHELAYEDVTGAGAVGPGPYRRPVEHARTLYRRDDLSAALPLGDAEPLGLVHEAYQLAYTASLLAACLRSRDGADTPLLTDAADLLGGEAGYQPGDAYRSDGLFPADDPAGQWWLGSGRSGFSADPADPPATELAYAQAHFFLPTRMRDPFGAVSTLRYDRYDLLPQQAADALGNLTTAGERGVDGSLATPGQDYRVLEPRLVTDANRNRVAAAYDALGRLVATAVMGKPEENLGDSVAGLDPDPAPPAVAAYFADPLADPAALLGDASTRVVYDLAAYKRTRGDAQPQPVVAATLTRETHVADLAAGASSPIRHRLGYSDGFGRQIQAKAQAAPGPLSDGGVVVDPRWIASGWVVHSNKGLPVRRYEPFFTAGHHFEPDATAGVSPVLVYDPLGRGVATLHPEDSYDKVVFHPWRRDNWDANDTVLLDPRTDPDVQGAAGGYLGTLPAAWQSWYARRSGGALGATEAAAASQAAAHAGTPTTGLVDPLGRTFLSVAHHRSTGAGPVVDAFYPTLTALDIEGAQVAIRDAKGGTVVLRELDLLGRVAVVGGAEAGYRVSLLDAAGHPVRVWDSRGHTVRLGYDALRRPVRRYVRAGAGPELLVERTVYGEADPDALAHNLRTRSRLTLDDAGLTRVDGYDFTGNPVTSLRQLRTGWQDAADWSTVDGATDAQLIAGAAQALLEPTGYTVSTSYDAVDRPTSVTHPDGSVLRPRYDETGLAVRLDVRVRAAVTWTPFVTDIGYDAHGRRTGIGLGNGARVEYRYDPRTFRLTGQRATAGGSLVQDLGYTYDPVGNITTLRDGAQQAVFFAGAVVEPTAGYTYDALYRLAAATGREHVGQQSQPPSATDPVAAAIPHPNDLAAMRRYTEQYDYDEVGNLRSLVHQAGVGGWTRSFSYAEQSALPGGATGNRLSSAQVGGGPVEAYSYDQHGNVTAMPQLTALDWGDTDRLVHVDRGGGGDAYYAYDSAGQRIRKVLTRQNGSRQAERLYLAGFEVYREFDAAGETVTLSRESLHLLDAGRRVAMVDTRTAGDDATPVQVVRYQLDNHAGSACVELAADAAVLSYEEYFPFGATSFHSALGGAAPPKRYRYAGKERDEETGFTYHGARYYAPWLCRWTAVEPSGLPDGVNAYAFARNNPIRYGDPDGEEARLIVDPQNRTVTVQTTVHLYAQTAKERKLLQGAGTDAQHWWANPTVATEAQVNAAQAAKQPIPNSGLSATINGQQWTLRFDITYQVHQRDTAAVNPAAANTNVYDIDQAKATSQNFAVGDNAITLKTGAAGAPIGGSVTHYTLNGTVKTNLTGEVLVPPGVSPSQVAVRLQHETGHAIGLDERYDPVTASFARGGYPGFDWDVMGADTGYATKVLDPSHVEDYLTVGAGLAAAQGQHPATKTYLLSGDVDDTKGGTLRTSAATFAATRQAANAAAVTRIQANTTAWENRQQTPRNDASDLVPHVPFGLVNVIAPPAPPVRRQQQQQPQPAGKRP